MRRSVQLITLHCALIAAEESSILAASRRVGMHHSALSRRIRELEQVLGVSLFDRHPGGVRPTPTGRQFIERLRAVLTDLDDTLTLVRQTSNVKHGSLSIGFEAPILPSDMLGTITDFLKDRPNVGVRFREGSAATLSSDIEGEAIDVVVGFHPGERQSKSSLSLCAEPVVVAVPGGHSLAGRGAVDPAALHGQTLLLPEHARPWCDPLLDRIGCRPLLQSVVRHDIGRECLLELVRKGLGISLLRQREVQSGHTYVRTVPFCHDGDSVGVRYFARWNPANSNPVLACFVGYLRDRYGHT